MDIHIVVFFSVWVDIAFVFAVITTVLRIVRYIVSIVLG
jgi:hypothetical protein